MEFKMVILELELKDQMLGSYSFNYYC